MKRVYYAILLICVCIITFNCQKEISYSEPGMPGGSNNSSPIIATLQGNIIDESGLPATGVTIHAGTKTAITDARGHFRIINATLDKKASLVIAEKTGYFRAYRTFCATPGANKVVIQLIKKVLMGSVNATTGGIVSLFNGNKIALPSNGIINAAGDAYTGSVNVHAAYIDPTSPDIAKTVPGSFLANDKNGNKVVLASYGMLVVELESSAGEKLQIASGSKATLTTAIPAALQNSAPASISLWYVDEQTGIWKEEGIATRNGNDYIGEVKHFSYWNCDIPGPTVTLSATFINFKGLPLAYAEIRIRQATTYGSAHGITDSLGQVNDPVPANMNLVLELMGPCNTVIYSKDIGPFSSDVNLGTITVDNNVSIITVQGRLLNCNSNPVTDGYAIINYNNGVNYISVQNDNGEFATTFYTCTGMPSYCEIVGVDKTAQQQGATINVSVASPITNAGNINTCGTSTQQYINYNLDGVNYSITSAGNDSLSSFTEQTQATPALATWMGGLNLTTNDKIHLSFAHDAAPGTYSLVYWLSVQNFDTTVLVQPFTVIITSYPPGVNGFYEGTFSGQFTESSSPLSVHNISGSFRIRRS